MSYARRPLGAVEHPIEEDPEPGDPWYTVPIEDELPPLDPRENNVPDPVEEIDWPPAAPDPTETPVIPPYVAPPYVPPESPIIREVVPEGPGDPYQLPDVIVHANPWPWGWIIGGGVLVALAMSRPRR